MNIIKTKNRHIFTKIPAPGTKKLIKKISKIESRSMHGQVPIAWDKAKNFNIYDIAGNKFIDFTSTIFVTNIGHSNPKLLKYLNQAINGKLIQVSNSSQLIISIDNIISLLSKYITLNKFDLICTGSGLPKPKARKNDNVKITINNLGELNSRI